MQLSSLKSSRDKHMQKAFLTKALSRRQRDKKEKKKQSAFWLFEDGAFVFLHAGLQRSRSNDVYVALLQRRKQDYLYASYMLVRQFFPTIDRMVSACNCLCFHGYSPRMLVWRSTGTYTSLLVAWKKGRSVFCLVFS